jgi:hypothetical protein
MRKDCSCRQEEASGRQIEPRPAKHLALQHRTSLRDPVRGPPPRVAPAATGLYGFHPLTIHSESAGLSGLPARRTQRLSWLGVPLENRVESRRSRCRLRRQGAWPRSAPTEPAERAPGVPWGGVRDERAGQAPWPRWGATAGLLPDERPHCPARGWSMTRQRAGQRRPTSVDTARCSGGGAPGHSRRPSSGRPHPREQHGQSAASLGPPGGPRLRSSAGG